MADAVDHRNRQFIDNVTFAQQSLGKTLLTDDELVVLACESISRTCTHEEKSYNS